MAQLAAHIDGGPILIVGTRAKSELGDVAPEQRPFRRGIDNAAGAAGAEQDRIRPAAKIEAFDVVDVALQGPSKVVSGQSGG